MTVLYPIKDHRGAFPIVEASGGSVSEAKTGETSLIQE